MRVLSRRSLALTAGLLLGVFSSCNRNRPPDVPAPAGPEYCLKDTTYTFTASAVDPEGDSVAIRFDWGDSSVTYWEGWLASGEAIALGHAWSDTGRYEIRVSAEDVKQHVSGLSDGHRVRVGYRWPPDAPSEPAGPDSGLTDTSYAFTSFAVHPGGATVALRFAWGDGDTSDWSPFVASGESVEMSHVWTSTGAWAVTAQAKDTGNALSDWSTPSNIVISLLKWRIRISPGGYLPQLSSPAIGSGGTIYVGSVDSSLYAVNPDGSIKWCAHSGIISGIMQSSPAVGMDGTVYFRDDYCLYALTPDESLSTNIVLRQQVMSSISIDAHDWAYVVTRVKIMSTGEFWFYNLDDGWAAPAFGVDGTVYLLLRNAGVIAYDPVPNPDPTIKWQYSAGGLNPTDPAIGGDGTVYFGMEDCLGADFIALSSDGTLRWTYLAGNAVRSSPAIDVDGTVYFGASDNYLYAFTSDGTLKWRFETGGDVNTSPALAADGTIYFGSDDSCLYAVNTDGTMKWRYSTGGPVESSPTIGSDGTVYFSSGDGYLYALDCRSPMANAPWPKYHHDLRNTACYGATN